MKTTTVRLPTELDKELEKYAKEEDLSKNQVIKKAIKNLVGEKTNSGGTHEN